MREKGWSYLVVRKSSTKQFFQIGGCGVIYHQLVLIRNSLDIGELRLLIPALQRITCDQARPVVLIRPPHVPYAPAWARAGLPLHRLVWLQPGTDAEAQWAAEQVLCAGIAGAVPLWSTATADVALRRLQLNAEEGHALVFVFRAPRALRNSSPAAVRLALQSATDALRIDVVKARGGHGGSVLCPFRCAA